MIAYANYFIYSSIILLEEVASPFFFNFNFHSIFLVFPEPLHYAIDDDQQ